MLTLAFPTGRHLPRAETLIVVRCTKLNALGRRRAAARSDKSTAGWATTRLAPATGLPAFPGRATWPRTALGKSSRARLTESFGRRAAELLLELFELLKSLPGLRLKAVEIFDRVESAFRLQAAFGKFFQFCAHLRFGQTAMGNAEGNALFGMPCIRTIRTAFLRAFAPAGATGLTHRLLEFPGGFELTRLLRPDQTLFFGKVKTLALIGWILAVCPALPPAASAGAALLRYFLKFLGALEFSNRKNA